MHENLIRDALKMRGCLRRQKTMTSRRRQVKDEDSFAPIDPFLADEAKLLSSKRFRLLEHMTQVLTKPMNPHIRNRNSHTMEVVACAVMTSDLLGLNTNLARAIAIGHDFGHVPLGHQGETWMKKAMGRPEFCHEIMGPIIVQKIERKGQGLNLTHATLEGMLRHSSKTSNEKMSAEALLIKYVDKIAYIFADYNDIHVRLRYRLPQSLHSLMDDFGTTQRERVATAIAGLVLESGKCGRVSFEFSPIAKAFAMLREMMYDIYPQVTQQNPNEILDPVLEFLRQLKIADPFLMMTLMTDIDVINLATTKMKNLEHLQNTALNEFLRHHDKIGKVDLCDPDLNW